MVVRCSGEPPFLSPPAIVQEFHSNQSLRSRESWLYHFLPICNYMHQLSLIPVMALSTAEVARQAGVHKDTLLRWLRAGVVREPARDRHGWRVFSPTEAANVVEFAKSPAAVPHVGDPLERQRNPRLTVLQSLDWDFASAKTNYLTHGIHPYPAKFIPQIPNALIQELSSVGDTVGDIFCGSGTTLVEALTLKRHAVGIDANPLACLISKAKTNVITEADASELAQLRDGMTRLAEEIRRNRQDSLIPATDFISGGWRPSAKVEFWFPTHVIEELAEIRKQCVDLPSDAARTLAFIAFSSIVVAVSHQDSDTRYVRREKNIEPGETFKRFSRALDQATKAAIEFSELVEHRFTCSIVEASLLSTPPIPKLDLVVCSPPYPNAYSYHLYHMTRMLWLEMDQPTFKKDEIGSHRKYSSPSKNAATVETFRNEFLTILEWLKGPLPIGRYACFVVGDSTLRGERINNADLISSVADECGGYREVARIPRTMQSTKKAFNPAIGKIKAEDILILERV